MHSPVILSFDAEAGYLDQSNKHRLCGLVYGLAASGGLHVFGGLGIGGEGAGRSRLSSQSHPTAKERSGGMKLTRAESFEELGLQVRACVRAR